MLVYQVCQPEASFLSTSSTIFSSIFFILDEEEQVLLNLVVLELIQQLQIHTYTK